MESTVQDRVRRRKDMSSPAGHVQVSGLATYLLRTRALEDDNVRQAAITNTKSDQQCVRGRRENMSANPPRSFLIQKRQGCKTPPRNSGKSLTKLASRQLPATNTKASSHSLSLRTHRLQRIHFDPHGTQSRRKPFAIVIAPRGPHWTPEKTDTRPC